MARTPRRDHGRHAAGRERGADIVSMSSLMVTDMQKTKVAYRGAAGGAVRLVCELL
jgi:hypothetical protein